MLKYKIGERIKQLRVAKLFMNQDEFARKLGLDKTYLCRIESGKQNVTIETLQIICNGLGISLREFFSVFTDSN